MRQIGYIVLFVALSCGTIDGQQPGDGIPDLYLFWTFPDGSPAIESVQTSIGTVSRPPGTILLDTDYLTGATASLPDPTAGAPLFASSWTTGYINNRSQYIRTNPLDTDGFVGVIGEYEDPFGIFPMLGLAHYDGCPEDFGQVIVATNKMGELTADVGPILLGGPGCVPEPCGYALVLVAMSVYSIACRRP